MTIPTKASITTAHNYLSTLLHNTPVLSSAFFNAEFDAQLYFKCENFQKTGSFKARGATNAIRKLSEAQKAKGVCTHSSGNHGQALAWAAQQQGIPAYVVVPENAPKVKLAAMEGYGAQLTLCAPNLASRESELEKVMANTGATFIPPYNYYDVIEGQASCAKELLEQHPDLDILIAPVGGGGLLSGTALSAHYFGKPELQVFGGEPTLADDAYRSFKSKKLIPLEHTSTIADGLRTSLGEKTFGVISAYVHNILLADEEAIKAAMRDIWQRMKIIVEPSCAVPLAAMRQHKAMFQHKKVGLIITGGNVDLSSLPFE
jgi:threonine dehydratase